jgi:uncharacterized integral membrane protein
MGATRKPIICSELTDEQASGGCVRTIDTRHSDAQSQVTGSVQIALCPSDAEEGNVMRWLHLTVVVLICAAVLLFIVQNFESATMTFMGWSIRMPLSILAVILYLLGMVTGGSLLALLRWSIEGWRRPEMAP